LGNVVGNYADWILTAMCYLIYLSTTSPEDLSRLPSKLYHFRPIAKEDDPAIVNLLDNPAQWYLECQYGGCSCHFRHLDGGRETDFFPPADWFPEDAEDIEATRAVYDLLARLLAEGHGVDLVDIWNGTPPEVITVLDVSLSEVGRDSFRFFEHRKFHLRR
jgi:hypothetical protein